ncbi:chemotaxis protein CheW [Maridesulfovibrio ferrireducens]|uniref:chemotaxis protein CheW n=1 Tax=Maridesulfovibrio ferrireducens TaxID=246191 RepID=UPI001A2AB73E|nr:chemotaxis protein CheW [Maridesulfovibrio ferrireducens]MBI9110791.1 chemotaxis protein CheW [Maridesulfovibrio ferrireducens]MBI9110793.1 chemotaxis protein CheW [Maridesulfovibrio ferrireducens]
MGDEMNSTMNQYLTFTLNKDIYALDISSVREVLELTPITRIPRTPKFMRGVINLRGHAVPVVDMRLKFGMSKTEDTINTCIIIVEVLFDGDSTVMGALADSVREVIEFTEDMIEEPPRMGTTIKTDFIRGMGKQDDDFVIILDINKILSVEELAMLKSAHQESSAEAVPEVNPEQGMTLNL